MNEINTRSEAFSKELRALMEWEERENDKIIARLKSDGRILGLDSCPEEFANVRLKRNRRLRELLERYKDLPPGTKLKLW